MRIVRALSAALLAGLLAATTTAAGAAGEESGKPEVGKPAPDITLPAAGVKGKTELSLKDFRGKKNVVLFFFPRAMTPGCTAQCKGFTALAEKYEKLDTVPVGISTDKLDAQEKFTTKDALGIALFADADMTAAKAYGVLPPGGKAARRTTFVIDKKGVVRKIFEKVDARANPEEVLEYVQKHLAGK